MSGLEIAAVMLFIRKLWSYNDRPWQDLRDDIHAAASSLQHSPPGQAYIGFQPGPALRLRDYELIGEAAEAAKKQDEQAKAARRRERRRRNAGQSPSRTASE